ncbi:hypothetical protein HNQ59_001265 [Chitinivorax tropicus]|uniref:Uncharacterized protein n=1 Tax=Chitinivorax tropicus TaxID=714531 RepID=A0A840MHV5_9PROT|nr:hypothetical protein [Chitinivorax tropicus]MBB5017980.1 hypothetical protein [Chitinivorax tropicus]
MPITMELDGHYLIWNGKRYRLKQSTLGASLPPGTYQLLLNGQLTERDMAARQCMLSAAHRVQRNREGGLDLPNISGRIRTVAADLPTREATRNRPAFYLLDGSDRFAGSVGLIVEGGFFPALRRVLHTDSPVDITLFVRHHGKRSAPLPMAAVA